MRKQLALILAAAALLASACVSSATRATGSSEVLRLGIFPNLTHAPGYVALGSGILEEALSPTKVETTVFNSGTEAGEALIAGSIDGTYIGPGPAASLYVQSQGNVAIVSGAVSGGASFVVRNGTNINGPEDMPGKKIAIPNIGNTQDVALRTWLHEHDLEAQDAGGEVAVLEVDNPELIQLFRSGEIDAAWEPEPYPSLLVAEGLAQVYVDEASLWPDGEFVTTHLLINARYMDAHREVVEKLVRANVEAIELIESDPERAKDIARRELAEAGAPELSPEVLDAAWGKLTFTWDPLISSFQQGVHDAVDLGYLDEAPGMLAIYRLDPLNQVLADKDLPTIEVSA
jgi:NitT/TauT family transport system substrate-binding protein